MQQSTDEDFEELLLQWEHVKTISRPYSESANEAIVREYAKHLIEGFAYKVRLSRLENNSSAETFYMEKFVENFKKYNKDLTFRILKNG
jgi:hypothetical protein